MTFTLGSVAARCCQCLLSSFIASRWLRGPVDHARCKWRYRVLALKRSTLLRGEWAFAELRMALNTCRNNEDNVSLQRSLSPMVLQSDAADAELVAEYEQHQCVAMASGCCIVMTSWTPSTGVHATSQTVEALVATDFRVSHLRGCWQTMAACQQITHGVSLYRGRPLRGLRRTAWQEGAGQAAGGAGGRVAREGGRHGGAPGRRLPRRRPQAGEQAAAGAIRWLAAKRLHALCPLGMDRMRDSLALLTLCLHWLHAGSELATHDAHLPGGFTSVRCSRIVEKSGTYSDAAPSAQAYDRKLTEVECQRAELEAQRLDLQRKLRDLQSANAEERARLKAQYQVRSATHVQLSMSAVEIGRVAALATLSVTSVVCVQQLLLSSAKVCNVGQAARETA